MRQEAAAAAPSADLACAPAAAVLAHVAAVGESLILAKAHSTRWVAVLKGWMAGGWCNAWLCLYAGAAGTGEGAGVFVGGNLYVNCHHLPCITCLPCSSWENNLIPYLAPMFGGDKGPATVTSHGLHHWALRHMGEPPVVSCLRSYIV